MEELEKNESWVVVSMQLPREKCEWNNCYDQIELKSAVKLCPHFYLLHKIMPHPKSSWNKELVIVT